MASTGPSTNLPLVQIILLCLVLLHQVVEHLSQPLPVRLEGGHHILHGPLNQDAIDQSEAFATL